MADQQIGNVHGVAAAHAGDADSPTNLSGTADPQGGFFDTNMHDISALRTRLTAIDGTFYDADMLNSMSYNDMVYAVRVNDAAATI